MRKKFYSATTITCFVLVILPCLVTALGCTIPRYVKLKGYVIEYSTSRNFRLIENNDGYNAIRIGFGRLQYDCIRAYSRDEEELRRFNELCIKNMDTKNNERLRVVGTFVSVRRTYFSEQVKGVTVTCSVDIDAQHPAGSPLNDMFLFLSGSPDTFIDNGYRSLDIDKEAFLKDLPSNFVSFAWNNLFYVWGESPKQTLLPVYGKLSDIDFLKYRLTGTCSRYGTNPDFALIDWVSPPPSNLDDYVLTVEIEFVDGVKKSASIAVKNQS